jgi:hypothetical protein
LVVLFDLILSSKYNQAQSDFDALMQGKRNRKDTKSISLKENGYKNLLDTAVNGI